jgi:hypothetical protein
MATFDIVSEVDLQEVRNAVDQTAREVGTRYDFKNTNTKVELGEGEITLESASEDRMSALRQVLEEKLVKRKVSLKSLEFETLEEASGGRARQKATISAGINKDKSRELNKFIKGLGMKGDQLQEVIAALKAEDFGIPLQYTNFREK